MNKQKYIKIVFNFVFVFILLALMPALSVSAEEAKFPTELKMDEWVEFKGDARKGYTIRLKLCSAENDKTVFDKVQAEFKDNYSGVSVSGEVTYYHRSEDKEGNVKSEYFIITGNNPEARYKNATVERSTEKIYNPECDAVLDAFRKAIDDDDANYAKGIRYDISFQGN